MTPIQYITKSDAACATAAEVIALQRSNPQDLTILKEWAKEEMKNRGVEITEK